MWSGRYFSTHGRLSISKSVRYFDHPTEKDMWFDTAARVLAGTVTVVGTGTALGYFFKKDDEVVSDKAAIVHYATKRLRRHELITSALAPFSASEPLGFFTLIAGGSVAMAFGFEALLTGSIRSLGFAGCSILVPMVVLQITDTKYRQHKFSRDDYRNFLTKIAAQPFTPEMQVEYQVVRAMAQ